MLTPNEKVVMDEALALFVKWLKQPGKKTQTPGVRLWRQDKMTEARMRWALDKAVAIPYGGDEDRPGEVAVKIRRFLMSPEAKQRALGLIGVSNTDDLAGEVAAGELDELRRDGNVPNVVFEGEDGRIYEGCYEYLISPILGAAEVAYYRAEFPEPKEEPCTPKKSRSTKRTSKPTSKWTPTKKRRRPKT